MALPLNTLFVESGTTGGGSFESLYQLLRKIDQSKVKPYVCFLNRTRYLEMVRELGVKTFLVTDLVYSNKVPKLIRGNLERRVDRVFVKRPEFAEMVVNLGHGLLISRLCSIVEQEKIKLLYCNDQIKRDIFGCYVARKAGIPFVSHLRSMDGKTFSGAKVGFANKWVNAYIANSKQVANYWIGQGAASEKMHVVNNAVEKGDVQPVDIRRELNLPATTKIVISMGRLVALKGHPFLLESFLLLLKSGVEAHLVIAGEGPDKEKLESLAFSLGVNNDITFLGHDPRGSALIAGADLLALTSNNEAFGRVLIEAMLVGVPVVGTNIGGIPDVVEDGVNGLIVEYGDRKSLSNAFERLLLDEDLRARCIDGGYSTVSTKYDLEARTKDIENIILDVADKARCLPEQQQ